jgi:peptidoglycan/LPS O-acetylase OafA/YrhL
VLGIFRYALALMVALSHLFSELMYWQGAYAVFCFYLISGYLMTLVLKEVYIGFDGAGPYVLNRLLRIYPVYFVALCASLLVSKLFPEVQAEATGTGLQFSQVMPLPLSTSDWLSNITLLFPWDSSLQISQAWSISVELVFYGLMPFIVTRLWTVALWFIGSGLIAAYMFFSGDSFLERYTSVAGASIAFSLGAVVYYSRKRFQLHPWHIASAGALYILHLWFAPDIWSFPRVNGEGFAWLLRPSHYGLYANLACGTYLLLAIISVGKRWKIVEKIGSSLGNLAYPIFLVHWIAGATVVRLGISPYDIFWYVPYSLALAHIAAILLHDRIENPINRRLRDKIRSSAPAKATPT